MCSCHRPTSRCSQTGADASLAPAAERQTRSTDSQRMEVGFVYLNEPLVLAFGDTAGGVAQARVQFRFISGLHSVVRRKSLVCKSKCALWRASAPGLAGTFEYSLDLFFLPVHMSSCSGHSGVSMQSETSCFWVQEQMIAPVDCRTRRCSRPSPASRARQLNGNPLS